MYYLILFIFCNLLQRSDQATTQGYRWTIPILEQKACIGNQTCPAPKGGFEKHTFCNFKNNFTEIQEKSNFKQISIDNHMKLIYLLGINGIRNKIAMDWRLGNMNRLHWDTLLQKLSERFLWKCQFTTDTCEYFGSKDYTISHNLAFVKRKDLDDDNPHGYAVRKWYSEFVKKESSFEEYETRFKKGVKGIGNFTNMIWPTTELMGCASAQ